MLNAVSPLSRFSRQLPLTPCFSEVPPGYRNEKPLQRFVVRGLSRKTAKAVMKRDWSPPPQLKQVLMILDIPRRVATSQVSARWKNSSNAPAIARIGQAEIATIITKNNASATNSKLFSLAK
jgi:hypothetical protein